MKMMLGVREALAILSSALHKTLMWGHQGLLKDFMITSKNNKQRPKEHSICVYMEMVQSVLSLL